MFRAGYPLHGSRKFATVDIVVTIDAAIMNPARVIPATIKAPLSPNQYSQTSVAQQRGEHGGNVSIVPIARLITETKAHPPDCALALQGRLKWRGGQAIAVKEVAVGI
jgi:hypothetical protein